MKGSYLIVLFAAMFSVTQIFAQQGVHGPKTILNTQIISVNEYTALTGTTWAGSTSLPVTNSALNSNGRFALSLQPGDLIMIIQMQGVVMNNQFSVGSADTTWGKIVNTGDYYSCGRYEFHQVVSVPNINTINIDCGLTYDYILGAAGRKCQIVRVPRYSALTIDLGGVLTCDNWNGTVGGVLAAEVQGNTAINGSVIATGRGFRGGSLIGDNVTSYGVNTTYSTDPTMGAEKGEGVAGYQNDLDIQGGRYCRAPAVNGGGGGDGHNSGGGGGSNAPNSTSPTAYWSGNGIPDLTGPNWTTAWNLEPPINTMPLRNATNSAGGGRGGYTFSGNNQNAITVGPGNGAWGGDSRNHQATGLGGRPLYYGNGRLFLGGGGGAGDQNQSAGGNGGNGGGLIYLMVYGNISGTGTVVSNGNNGGDGVGGAGYPNGLDAAGGAGAGGTIVLNAVGVISNTFSVATNGGTGGNQIINGTPFTDEGEGPGGGGGGGYIAVSNGTPPRTSNGGNNGTTNSAGLTEFIPNGATKGCPGTNNASITNFYLTLTDITICTGNTTTLNAVLTGNPPGGTTIYWYNASVGGVSFFSGASYTTPILTTGVYTYWVGTCPGWWRKPVTVTVVGTPTVTATASPSTICSGSSTTLTGGGATTYTWNPGNISGSPISVSPATTTTYTVTGVAVGGCFSTAQVTVTVNPTPTVTATASSPTICAGNSTNLTGGGATSYVWNPGNISGSPITVSPASTTTYTVTGTTTGCSSTAQVTVTVNPSPTVTATASSPTICSGNSTNLTGGGATSYVWNPGNISGSPISVSPASTTTYTVTGTGGNGCTSTAQVTVTVNPTPTVTATASSSTICAGNSTTLTGSGATSYIWNPGNISGSPISVTPASTMTYTVTGTTGTCSNTAQVIITVNPLPIPTITANPTAICVGQSASLTATGGTSYNWNGGSLVNASGNPQTVSPVSTTTYTVTATDANGCFANAQLSLTVNPLPTPNAGADQTICEGNPVSLVATGGGTYSWNGGSLVNSPGASQSVSPVITTNYIVTVTNAFGCQKNDTTSIIVNPAPTTNAGIDVSICPNSSIQLNATGAASYLWTPSTGLNFNNISNPIASPTVTTTYVITGTNAFGCTRNDTIVVTVANNLSVFAGADVAICYGDTVLLSTSGGATYSWSPSASLQTPNAASTNAFPTVTTTYTVNVTDANSCQGLDSVTVFVNSQLSLTTSGATTICIGQSTSINATPVGGSSPYVYNWSNSLSGPGPQTVSPTTSTTYTVSVTDSLGCISAQQNILITVNPSLALNAISDTSVCAGNSITINATGTGGDGNLTYTWLPGNLIGSSQTLAPTVNTTYSVVISDGCATPEDTVYFTVNVNALPVVTVQSSSAVTCFGGNDGSASMTASGGISPYTYAWSPSGGNAASANGLTAGTYSLIVTDSAGCPQTQTVTITEPTQIVATTTSSPEHCTNADGSATVISAGGNPGYTYVWSDGSTTDSISNLVAGTYTVTVTDLNGCTSSSTIVVANTGGANANAGTSVTIISGNSTILSGSGGVTYSWSPATDLSCSTCQNPVASPTVTTIYTLTVVDVNGCIGSDTVTVFVDEACGDIFVPNAFSPNADTQNDTLYVRGGCIKFMDFEIYNRWGEKVFFSGDPAVGWDGTWRGQPCEAAVFTYLLRVTLNDDTQIDRQGTITIVK
ncbi:hypothetical protein BH09BAC5_BH09BAC5_20960 [soil metagenome]